jgi:hypothetical protein
MIVLEANYSKKLGLPGYSSHQYSLTLRTELEDVSQVDSESKRLHGLLQASVDRELKATGFLPGTNGNGNGHHNGASRNGHQEERWDCSDKQRALILSVIEENHLNKHEVENLAQDRFGKTLTRLNKLEASGLIEELFAQTGQNNGRRNGGNRFQRAGAR